VTSTAGPDLLATIVAATRRAVDIRARTAAIDVSRARTPDGQAFERGLSESTAPRIIAECKRRSPSRGILRESYDPAAVAAAYVEAGAAAISVLTEPTFFDGSPQHLRDVRAAVNVPLLRKDFIVSDYQIAEAIEWGADAVLLIVGALDDRELRHLLRRAHEAGLASLVEVHDRVELDRALEANARIVGVNCRNLRTLEVHLEVLETLAPLIPAGIVAVAESGIRTRADIDRLSEAGYRAFLVGERLIAQPDAGMALRQLRG
jgi:indole-3-glycerol phosphate synthase